MGSVTPDIGHPDGLRPNQHGCTLTEVLVALSITTVGLIAMAVGLQQAAAFLEMGRQQTMALFLAQQRLEQVKGAALSNFDGLTTSNFPAEDPVSKYPGYRRTVDIVPAAGAADAVRVRITVAYRPLGTTSGAQRELTVMLATIMSRRR